MKNKFIAALSAAAMILLAVTTTPIVTVKADTAPVLSFDFENGMEGLTVVENETAAPEVISDDVKGNVLHMVFGGGGVESAATFENPYKGLDLEAITMTAWVKVPATAPYMEFDELFGFTNGISRLTLQTKPYLCYNAGDAGVPNNWIDWKSTTNAWLGFIPELLGPNYDTWQHYAVTIAGNTITLFLNGVEIPQAAENSGEGFGSEEALSMLDFIAQDDVVAAFGQGSFWGSQDCFLDDVTFYASELTIDEIIANAGLTEVGYPLGYSSAPEDTPAPTEEPEVTAEPTTAPTVTPTTDPADTDSKDDGSNTTIIIVVVIAVVVVAGCGIFIMQKKKTK